MQNMCRRLIISHQCRLTSSKYLLCFGQQRFFYKIPSSMSHVLLSKIIRCYNAHIKSVKSAFSKMLPWEISCVNVYIVFVEKISTITNAL